MEKYSLIFPDASVALREADKDAATLLGNPALLPEANIRLHLGPVQSACHRNNRILFGSRCGKNLRLTMVAKVLGHLIDCKKNGSFLTIDMEPGKAYSCLDGIEHTQGLWIDEAQGNKKRGVWNGEFLLRLATGSARTQFQYRKEFNHEKTVTLKMQNVNIMSNSLDGARELVHNPGFLSKFEVSPYPRVGFVEPQDVAESIEKGQPAFLIESSMLDYVASRPGQTARYYVQRAVEIDKNPRCAYAATPQHRKKKDELLELFHRRPALEGPEATQRLKAFTHSHLVFCRGPDSSTDDATPDIAQLAQLQTKGATRRCLCSEKPACHFTVSEFASLLERKDTELFDFYVSRPGQTQQLQEATQRLLGLEVTEIKQKSGYPRGSIFGAKLSRGRATATAVEVHASPGTEAVEVQPPLGAEADGAQRPLP